MNKMIIVKAQIHKTIGMLNKKRIYSKYDAGMSRLGGISAFLI